MKGRCTDVKETREWPLDCWLYLEECPLLAAVII